MVDETTLVLVGSALLGCGAVVQHFYDRYSSKGLYKSTQTQLAKTLTSLPPAIGMEVKNAVEPLSAQLQAFTPDAIGGAMYDAMTRLAGEQQASLAAEAASAVKSAEMSMVRGVRTVKDMDRQADKFIGQAILGAGQGVLMALRTVAPTLADQIEEMLEENPEGAMQLWELIQARPSFQKYIAPRLNAYLNPPQQGHISATETGWGP